MKKLLKQSIIKIVIIFTSAFLLTQTSFAYLSLSETAELIKVDHYRVGVIPQLLIANGSGSNVGVFFDLPIDSEMNSRFMIGGGTTDFWASGSVKWVPFPDFQRQPAMGIRGSFIYARDANVNGGAVNFYNFQATPIVSKIIETQWGTMNPYIGLPITLVFNSTKNTTAMQFVMGNEWLTHQTFQVGAELDLNLSEAATALTLHINFPFDGKIGFRK